MGGFTPRIVAMLARAGTVGALATSLMVLPGCGGHGVFTQEAKDDADAATARMRGATQYDVAWQQYRGGNLTTALETTDASLANAPEVSNGHLLRGRILLELGRLPEAAESLAKAVEIDPEDPDAPYFLGVVHERNEDIEAALASYRSAIGIRDQTGRSRLAAAELLVDAGRLGEARSLLDDGSAIARDHAGFRQLLGHIALQEGQRETAVKRFLEAVVIAPDDPVLREDLAYAQISAEQYRSAEATIRRLRDFPEQGERIDLKVMHARCLLEGGRAADAREMLIELSSLDDAVAQETAWSTLVDVALVTGDQKLLFRAGTELVTSSPSRVEGYLALALWHRSQRDYVAAIRNVEDAILHCGEDPSARALERTLRNEIAAGA